LESKKGIKKAPLIRIFGESLVFQLNLSWQSIRFSQATFFLYFSAMEISLSSRKESRPHHSAFNDIVLGTLHESEVKELIG